MSLNLIALSLYSCVDKPNCKDSAACVPIENSLRVLWLCTPFCKIVFSTSKCFNRLHFKMWKQSGFASVLVNDMHRVRNTTLVRFDKMHTLRPSVCVLCEFFVVEVVRNFYMQIKTTTYNSRNKHSVYYKQEF